MFNRYDYSMSMPRSLYSINEDRTRENLRQYRAWKNRLYELFYAEYPDHEIMGLRERVEAMEKIKERIGYPY